MCKIQDKANNNNEDVRKILHLAMKLKEPLYLFDIG
jgi:hypothetical protein